MFQLERVKIVIIEIKWNEQGKGMILIDLIFYRSHVSGRPGFRIYSVLSRGALKWVTWSHLCGELKPLHTCISSFLVLVWLLSLWEFRACVHLHTKLQFIKNGFHINILLHFWCSRFYRFVFSKRGQTLSLWLPPHMMDYDVSLHNLEEFFVAIPTSPRSLKSESEWKSYYSFRFVVSVSFQTTGYSD